MLKKTLACAVLAVTSHAALAANNLEMKVRGNITPVACNITLGNGGIIDYGNISPEKLISDNYLLLETKAISLEINCEAPIKIGIKTISLRASTAPDGVQFPSGNNRLVIKGKVYSYHHGLGLSNGMKIGGYSMSTAYNATSADGKPAKPINSSQGEAWKIPSYGSLIGKYNDNIQTWSELNKLEPMTFKNLNTNLFIHPYINKKSALDFNQPLKLDGVSTIELVYL